MFLRYCEGTCMGFGGPSCSPLHRGHVPARIYGQVRVPRFFKGYQNIPVCAEPTPWSLRTTPSPLDQENAGHGWRRRTVQGHVPSVLRRYVSLVSGPISEHKAAESPAVTCPRNTSGRWSLGFPRIGGSGQGTGDTYPRENPRGNMSPFWCLPRASGLWYH